MIELHDVSHAYESAVILRHITATLSEHRIGITGPNGSGKSALIRMMNGLVIPTRGDVIVNGHNTRKKSAEIRHHTGFIFSDPRTQILMPTLCEDVEFSLRRRIKDKKERHNVALHYLDQFGLAERADCSPHELSGGQQQLLAIASIMAIEPDLILADEPTALLDLRNTRRLLRIFQRIDAQIVLVSHDFSVLRQMDRVIVINNGTIFADGTPQESLDAYETLIDVEEDHAKLL